MSTPDLMGKIRKIEATGCSIGEQEIRQRLLNLAMGARVDKPAEYAIITGCRSTSTFMHVWALVKLLRHFDVDYTFLGEEVCCGNSFLEYIDPREVAAEEVESYEDHARTFENQNISRMKELGVKTIVTACPGCNTRYNQFQMVDGKPGAAGMPVLYYTQLLAPYIEKVKDDLNLDGQVDFYEGCHQHHRIGSFKIDTVTSSMLAGEVNGLTCSDIPNFCCRKLADKIFARASTGIIVTPTTCCWSFLTRQRKDDSPRVMYLSEILCQALGIW